MHMSVALLIFFLFFRTYAPRACVRADAKQHVVERRSRGVRVLSASSRPLLRVLRTRIFFPRSKPPRTARFPAPCANVQRVVKDVRDASPLTKVAENFNPRTGLCFDRHRFQIM